MLIAATSEGPARVVEGGFELLAVGQVTLTELIAAGQVHALLQARPCGTANRDDLSILAPIRPGKFVVVGLNYRDHAAEIGVDPPAVPRFNYAPGSAVSNPGDDIVLPAFAPDEVDYEGEVAVVIGRCANAVSKHDAWDYIAGVTAANDVSARDVQLGRPPHLSGPNVGVGKGFPTFKPLGPALLTGDDPRARMPLRVTTRVAGELRQTSTTANLVFDIPQLVSTVSRYTILDPGDVILTGTPGGVGMTSGRYLQTGQTVEVEVEHVGVLRNRVGSAR